MRGEAIAREERGGKEDEKWQREGEDTRKREERDREKRRRDILAPPTERSKARDGEGVATVTRRGQAGQRARPGLPLCGGEGEEREEEEEEKGSTRK